MDMELITFSSIHYRFSSLLHEAVIRGEILNLSLLLDQGFYVDTTDADSRTPLFEACLRNKIECVNILLKYGANVNAVSVDGTSPIHEACRAGNAECVELLLEAGAKVNLPLSLNSPLHEACFKGNLACVRLLIDAGADMNANDCNVGTPLHVATARDKKSCVLHLLLSGANVNSLRNHQTPLHIATNRYYPICGEILICFGANVFAKDFFGRQPESLLSVYSEKFINLLKWKETNPTSLQDFCRRVIRSTLGAERLKYIKDLEVPHILKDYLEYSELNIYKENEI